jgi:CubicO group peptidase (beta-lactamase class C family)
MTIPYFFQDGKIKRGLGWDIESPFSSPRGESFSEISFGHTGYSGCSIWIDPKTEVFVVLLTARLDYKRIKEFNLLRSHLSTAAAHLAAVRQEMRIFARKSE